MQNSVLDTGDYNNEQKVIFIKVVQFLVGFVKASNEPRKGERQINCKTELSEQVKVH